MTKATSVRQRTTPTLPEAAEQTIQKYETPLEIQDGGEEQATASRDMVEVTSRSRQGMLRKSWARMKQLFTGPAPNKVDKLSRLLFPLSYALYNAGYWYVYLNDVSVVA